MASSPPALLARLHDACAAVDVYYHVWETETAFVDTAARGGERMDVTGGDGAAEMVKLLRPFGARGTTDKQATFDLAFARNASSYAALDRRYAGPNFRNLMRQLESLRRVAALWRRSGVPYEAVVYARPDLKFLDAIDAGHFKFEFIFCSESCRPVDSASIS